MLVPQVRDTSYFQFIAGPLPATAAVRRSKMSKPTRKSNDVPRRKAELYRANAYAGPIRSQIEGPPASRDVSEMPLKNALEICKESIRSLPQVIADRGGFVDLGCPLSSSLGY